MTQPTRDRLDGWKEIADHLGKSVRTAQRWEEEHGLPVHRLAEADDRKGASVMAFADELDAWWEATFRNGKPGERGPLAVRVAQALSAIELPRAVLWASAALLVTLAVAAYALTARPAPYFARFAGDRELVVVDRDNDELWRYTFDTPVLQESWIDGDPVEVVDVNRDGAAEVLAWSGTAVSEPAPDDGVHLINAAGELVWQHRPGRAIRIAGISYDRLPVRAVATGSYGDGETFIVVVALRHSDPVTQVTILGTSQQVLGEYFHFGHVYDVHTLDADDDGVDEIVLAGENRGVAAAAAPPGSGRRQAFVALIEHDISGGISPGVTADAPGLEADLEKAYVALPFSSQANAEGFGNAAMEIRPTPSGFHVDVGDPSTNGGARLYTFSRRFELDRLVIKQGYFKAHQALLASGRISHTLEEEHERQRRVERIVWRLDDPPDPSRRP